MMIDESTILGLLDGDEDELISLGLPVSASTCVSYLVESRRSLQSEVARLKIKAAEACEDLRIAKSALRSFSRLATVSAAYQTTSHNTDAQDEITYCYQLLERLGLKKPGMRVFMHLEEIVYENMNLKNQLADSDKFANSVAEIAGSAIGDFVNPDNAD